MRKFPKEPHAWGTPLPGVEFPRIEFNPRYYICQKARGTNVLDGRLDKPFWEQAPWSEEFVDIEGDLRPRPTKRTRFKILWDQDYLYVGAELEEDQIWATVTKRDGEIHLDNCLEIMLDPDGDTHNYFELQINALNTVWDLLLTKPYRDGGRRINFWDMRGMQTAVHIEGELNNPMVENSLWSVELALPLRALREGAKVRRFPRTGDVWRLNLLRVNWDLRTVKGGYVKDTNARTGQPNHEANWVWSPMGLINAHYPELWGYLLFAEGSAQFRCHPDEQLKWKLRQVYYLQRRYKWLHGCYAENLEDLEIDDWAVMPKMEVTSNQFLAYLPTGDGKYRIMIRQDGRVWEEYF